MCEEVVTETLSCYVVIIKMMFRTIVCFLLLLNGESLADKSCVCGQQYVNNRIVGGKEVKPGAFPFNVAFLEPGDWYFCGGSIINSRWILTAAHCVQGMKENSFTIVINVTDLMAPKLKHLKAEKIIIHTNYSGRPHFLYDIALVKVNETMEFDNFTAPVCLPTPDMKEFSNLIATGFGMTSRYDPPSTKLLEVDLAQRNQTECEKLYGKYRFNERNICANQVGKDVCKGDSGGPLVTKSKGSLFLVGAVSWGIICGKYEYPSVYTRITEYLDWIHRYADEDAKWCAVK